MTPLDQTVIESLCRRLMIAYCIHADHGDAERFAALFADDGVWVQGNGNEINLPSEGQENAITVALAAATLECSNHC